LKNERYPESEIEKFTASARKKENKDITRDKKPKEKTVL
jgi:hypothetical protein